MEPMAKFNIWSNGKTMKSLKALGNQLKIWIMLKISSMIIKCSSMKVTSKSNTIYPNPHKKNFKIKTNPRPNTPRVGRIQSDLVLLLKNRQFHKDKW